jgi:hypothetical protein
VALTPASWLERLDAELTAQQRAIKVYEDYYDGNQRLAFATGKFRETFGSLFQAFADNWCPLVVDSAVERLQVQGFRFGEERDADNDANSIWQENNLDGESELAHTEAIKNGRAYTITEPPVGDAAPKITVEHPSQVVVAHAAGDRRQRVAALKRWLDESGYAMATVYLPDYIAKYRSQEKVKVGQTQRIQWVRRPGDEGGNNPLGVVPVIPLYNRPTMLRGGRSDLEPAIALQDATNKLVADMIVASEFAAFLQRWATGVEIPTDPETGRAQNPQDWLAGPGKLWAVGDSDAKFGTFAASDLSNYVAAIEMVVQHLAAQTKTPAHYLLAKMVNLSGDALKIAETGLVRRVERKHTWFGEGWEETMRLAFLAQGDSRADTTDAETIWAKAETRSEAELADVLVKLRSVGWSFEKPRGLRQHHQPHRRCGAHAGRGLERLPRGLTTSRPCSTSSPTCRSAARRPGSRSCRRSRSRTGSPATPVRSRRPRSTGRTST